MCVTCRSRPSRGRRRRARRRSRRPRAAGRSGGLRSAGPGRHRAADHRREAGVAEAAAEHVCDVAARSPLITSGVAIGRSIAPSCAPAAAGRPIDLDVGGPARETARAAHRRRVSAAVRPSRVTGRSIRACRRRRAARDVAVASFISCDRRDAGDGFLRERADRIRDGADQPAVDVDRAAAHAGDDAGLGQRAALEPGEDEVAAAAPGRCAARR